MYYCLETETPYTDDSVLKATIKLQEQGYEPTMIRISPELSIGDLYNHCNECRRITSCEVIRSYNSSKAINMNCFESKYETKTYKGHETYV